MLSRKVLRKRKVLLETENELLCHTEHWMLGNFLTDEVEIRRDNAVLSTHAENNRLNTEATFSSKL